MNAELNNLSRRIFLKTTALSTAAILAGRTISSGTEEKKEDKKLPIGVQLYSLRGLGGGSRGGFGGFGRGRGGARGGGGGMEVHSKASRNWVMTA